LTAKKLIINANGSEIRIALLEDGQLAQVFIEREKDKGLVGNVYKAKVSRILPGMQSAFVDIGIDRAAFLYGGDVIDPTAERAALREELDDAEDFKPQVRTPIEKLLRQGQEIVVQVAKDPIGSKGPRVTMFLAVPGRYVVMLSDTNHIGVSRRIEQASERDRLKKIVSEIKPEDVGVIIRTAAVDIESDAIARDMRYLNETWKMIVSKTSKSKAPSLLYREPELHMKTARDLYAKEVDEILIDNREAADELKSFLTRVIPEASEKVILYEGRNPIFDEYEIEFDIAKALNRKVWLPSGGYLVIDQTEALTSFDVNTGKFVGKLSAKETILKTNLEAVTEIVSQLRLRNIGGIIVLDLIDMEEQGDRDRVYNELESALKADKAKANVLKINELGLIQMTRKRTSESLQRQLTETCPHCDGLGSVRSLETSGFDLIRDIERYCVRTNATRLKIKIRKDLRDWLLREEQKLFNEICTRNNIAVEFIISALSRDDLTESHYELQMDG